MATEQLAMNLVILIEKWNTGYVDPATLLEVLRIATITYYNKNTLVVILFHTPSRKISHNDWYINNT